MSCKLLTLLCLTVFSAIATSTATQQPVILGSLTTLFHQTRGTVYAINEKTFYIENFDYDGQGVDAYVYVFLTGQTVSRSGGGTIINWSPMSVRLPRRFRSENITISLTNSNSTANLNISNIQTFTIWCRLFQVFYARLNLPANVDIPTVAAPTVVPVMPTCEQLLNDSQAHNTYKNQAVWLH